MNFFSKYKKVISLGSGCFISMNLNRCRLRKQAYVFDWVWNLDSGLSVVTDAIKDGFKKMSCRGNFIKTKHYGIDNKILVVINKEYPNTAFIHHDIMDDSEVYAAFLRRTERFLKLFENKKGKILFIYYREQGSITDTPKDELKNCDFMDLLENESLDFVNEIQKLYPNLKFDLLSLYAFHNNKSTIKLPKNRNFKNVHLFFDKLPAVAGEQAEDLKLWNENLDDIFYKYGIYADFNTFIKKYKNFTRFLGNVVKSVFKFKH